MTTKHVNIPASYLILKKENKVLLLRRFNTTYQNWNYSMVAWHVDPGENFTDCIIREAKEEAWITLKKENLEVVHILHRKSVTSVNDRIDAFFIATKWDWEVKIMEPNKCDDLSWFDLDDLPNNIVPCDKHALEQAFNWIHYSEYGWEK